MSTSAQGTMPRDLQAAKSPDEAVASAPAGPEGSSQTPVTPGPIPGGGLKLGEKAMQMGTGMMQSFKPISKICEHVCGIHLFCHDNTRQVRAHHFCNHVNSEFRQCIIFDSDKSDARLIGIEYIISRRLFESLPPEEQRYWHSHVYEVKSGMLTTPGVPELAEQAALKELVNTYGKTWHTWQVDRGDTLPLGPPQLMMAFTSDNQIRKELLADLDKYTNKSTQELRARREGIVPDPPEPHPAADHCWHTGKAWQVAMEQVEFRKE